MTVFFYRWKIKPGKEKQFEENWSVVTKAIKEQCGSYGSRLHLAGNGDYIGYAQWPGAQTRKRCELDLSLSQARSLVRGAIEYSYPEEQFEVKIDLLSF
ncbi:MAG: hypothetical protein AABY64_06205 [Bdellovibrionota bacterium]